MPQLPTTFHMDADHKWRWCLLDTRGIFLAVSVDAYDSFEEAERGYKLACLSLMQAN